MPELPEVEEAVARYRFACEEQYGGIEADDLEEFAGWLRAAGSLDAAVTASADGIQLLHLLQAYGWSDRSRQLALGAALIRGTPANRPDRFVSDALEDPVAVALLDQLASDPPPDEALWEQRFSLEAARQRVSGDYVAAFAYSALLALTEEYTWPLQGLIESASACLNANGTAYRSQAARAQSAVIRRAFSPAEWRALLTANQ